MKNFFFIFYILNDITKSVLSFSCIINFLLNDFESKIDLLSKKYETTYSDLEEEISKTEESLISMLNDLQGNDFDILGLDKFKTLLGGK